VASAILSLAPRLATASPIFHEIAVNSDGSFGGTFEWDNDVALMRFVLDEGVYDFTASTTSYDPDGGGFDTLLSLFYEPEPGDPLTLYSYGADGGTFFAWVDDVDSDLNASLDSLHLQLTAGTYVLALTQGLNYPHEDEVLGFEWSDDAFRCVAGPECDQLFGGQLPFFSGAMVVKPVESAPVPEPGTLSLLALGSLATAAVGRRRNRRVMTPQ
jgi:hypothetical protein